MFHLTALLQFKIRKLTQIHGRIPENENREQEAYLRAFFAAYLGIQIILNPKRK